MSHDIGLTTVLERNGNPIQISAIVVYRVENYRTFIKDQASAVIKRVSSQFPYESADHSDHFEIDVSIRSRSRSATSSLVP